MTVSFLRAFAITTALIAVLSAGGMPAGAGGSSGQFAEWQIPEAANGSSPVRIESRLDDLLADGQFVDGPNVGEFDLRRVLASTDAALGPYTDVIESACAFYSVNPRVMIAVLEMLRVGEVTAIPDGPPRFEAPLVERRIEVLAASLAEAFYRHLYAYGARSPSRPTRDAETTLDLADGTTVDVPARVSSGTYALLAALAGSASGGEWERLMSPADPGGFTATYRRLFPDSDPLDDTNRINPDAPPPANLLQLPYPLGSSWWFNGSHNWNGGGLGRPYSSMDFGTSANSCAAPPGGDWAVAAGGGTATHPNNYPCWLRIAHVGGWITSYYHLKSAQGGGDVARNDSLGTIGCETCAGGYATGPHLHFSLLFNGAYVELDGVQLSGWTVRAGSGNYSSGYLEKQGQKAYPYARVKNDGIPCVDPSASCVTTSTTTVTPSPSATASSTRTPAASATATATQAAEGTLTPTGQPAATPTASERASSTPTSTPTSGVTPLSPRLWLPLHLRWPTK